METESLKPRVAVLEYLVALLRGAGASAGQGFGFFTTATPQGPAATIAFDSPTYTPATTGFALVLGNASVTASNAGDEIDFKVRKNGSAPGNAITSVSSTASGNNSATPWDVIPIVKGTGLTVGVQASNGTGGHTVSSGSPALAVLIIELQ